MPREREVPLTVEVERRLWPATVVISREDADRIWQSTYVPEFQRPKPPTGRAD